MNWDRLEGQWKQQRGKSEHRWGKTMNDELAAIMGKYQELVGRLQEKHGVAKEEAEQKIELLKMQCTACPLKTAEQTKKLTKIKLKSKTPSRKNTVKGK